MRYVAGDSSCKPEPHKWLTAGLLSHKIGIIHGSFLLVQFRHRFAFALILFRQYLHFTMCLMMGSSAASSAMLARAYRARPTPMKLMTLLRNDLMNQWLAFASSIV
jgi:hypothetical protein